MGSSMALKLLVGLLAALAAACVSPATDSGGWIRVGSLDEIEQRGIVYLKEHNVFVVATGAGILALEGNAQHLNDDDRVLYGASSDGFEGPRHGERFDRQGRYRGGPAATDMNRVQLRVQATSVYINPTIVIQATERSQQATPPTGPQCLGTENPAGFFETN